MRTSFVDAVRGICAGLAVLAFVGLFLATQIRDVSLFVLLALFAAGVAGLLAAAGPTAVTAVFGDPRPSTRSDETSEWWLANVEHALEGAWNRWADLALGLGMAVLGVGSFALLVTSPREDPPLGLVVTGFLGVTGAMIVLPFALKPS
ncbi:hypothetical protein [Natrononativus amylolyticus]|uniref:hypothetical protein n=1 Tax=Natrononativus amylolyticus TaxID=2963434 RepID=UPI0020CFAFA5|nr:hypothetical protein [Natrononativus amylolyticus]